MAVYSRVPRLPADVADMLGADMVSMFPALPSTGVPPRKELLLLDRSNPPSPLLLPLPRLWMEWRTVEACSGEFLVVPVLACCGGMWKAAVLPYKAAMTASVENFIVDRCADFLAC